ncbi:MAG: hypothetical protein U0457_12275 [Candidatus Sericytochromatia bacterium]
MKKIILWLFIIIFIAIPFLNHLDYIFTFWGQSFKTMQKHAVNAMFNKFENYMYIYIPENNKELSLEDLNAYLNGKKYISNNKAHTDYFKKESDYYINYEKNSYKLIDPDTKKFNIIKLKSKLDSKKASFFNTPTFAYYIEKKDGSFYVYLYYMNPNYTNLTPFEEKLCHFKRYYKPKDMFCMNYFEKKQAGRVTMSKEFVVSKEAIK